MTLEHHNRSGAAAPGASRASQEADHAAAPAVAAEGAFSVVETVQLTASARHIWAAISAFSTWEQWHPAFASTTMLRGSGRVPGSVRVLVTKDGGRFTEELIAFDAVARSYAYRIIESPAPVRDYVSTIHVREVHGGSSVVWSSHFNVAAGTAPADAKQLISGVYRAGLDALVSAAVG